MSLVKMRPKFRAFRNVLREKTIVAVVLSGCSGGVRAMEVLRRWWLLCLVGMGEVLVSACKCLGVLASVEVWEC